MQSTRSIPRAGFALAILLVAILCTPLPILDSALAQDQEALASSPVSQILVTDVAPLILPAFHDEERAGVTLDDLFEATVAPLGANWPYTGNRFAAGPEGSMSWELQDADDGHFRWDRPEQGAAVRFVTFYIQSDSWQKASLEVRSAAAFKVSLDGQPVAFESGDADEAEPAVQTGELTLPIGKHLVELRSLCTDELEGDWTLDLALAPGEAGSDGSLTLAVTPDRAADIQKILNAPRISSVALSPDGSLVAIGLGEYRDGANQESWLEIRDTKEGKLRHLWRSHGAPTRVAWAPTGHRLTWRTNQDDQATLWIFDLQEGTTRPLLQDVAHLGGWQWTPDGNSIIYSVNREPDPDERRVKRVLHPADRQPWWRGRSHLMQVFVPDGLTRRLTAGPVSPGGWSVSPDSRHLMFFTSEPDLTARPYSASTLWLMDLTTLEVNEILSDPWIGGAVFGPDEHLICLQGSPSAFDGLGRNLPDGVQANDYGGQLYLYDLEKAEPRAITANLVPDVGSVEWSLDDGRLYVRTTDTQYSNIYRLKPGDKQWERVDTGLEYTNELVLPLSGRTAVARGSGSTTPNRLYAVDLKKNRSHLLLDPGEVAYRDIVFGRVENWPCTLPDGETLDGFVYYPPLFDPEREYPLIVYYYGGTSPVTRDFGGRYPKNVWAGQDYIVYVPEPSGATGYGQEFAARHVNDWGRLTADEVIQGTLAFLDAHPYVDKERVGCIGASYGGFLTEYIVTRTDLFAAAVSHAGISDISSYWGEGLWGYAYGARALANSFPWQDRELFVEQSPLFHADKITTPLLLVHGDSDVNVPRGESDQLFTALKLLGREVEYVQIQGQDHHILDHEQRIVWNDTILAFFAKTLKGRPAWWDALYPEPTDYR